MRAKIYQPTKNAMQSGRAGTKKWILEYELDSARKPEPLMGWVSSQDTLNQVRLRFETLQDAQNFAQDKNLEYTVLKPREKRVKPRNYSDNFKYIPPEAEDA